MLQELSELRQSGRQAQLMEGLAILATMLGDAATAGIDGYSATDALPPLQEAYEVSIILLECKDEAPPLAKRQKIALAAQVSQPQGLQDC